MRFIPFGTFVKRIPTDGQIAYDHVCLRNHTFIQSVLMIKIQIKVAKLRFNACDCQQRVIVVYAEPMNVFEAIIFQCIDNDCRQVSRPNAKIQKIRFIFFFVNLLQQISR